MEPHRTGSSIRWFTGPPGIWHIGAVAIVSLAIVYTQGTPHGLRSLILGAGFPWSLLLACAIWPGGALVLVIDYVVRLAVCARHRASSWRCWRWYVTPVCVAVVMHACLTHWPLHMRWERSRVAFEHEAKVLLSTPTTMPAGWEPNSDFVYGRFIDCGKPVGSYSVDRILVHADEELVFFSTGGFFRSDWGFLYNPRGCRECFVDEDLGAGWYTFTYDRP